MAAEYDHFSHKMLALLENCTSMSHEGPYGRTVLRDAVMQLDFRKFDYTLSVRIWIFRSFPAGFVHALSCPRVWQKDSQVIIFSWSPNLNSERLVVDKHWIWIIILFIFWLFTLRNELSCDATIIWKKEESDQRNRPLWVDSNSLRCILWKLRDGKFAIRNWSICFEHC